MIQSSTFRIAVLVRCLLYWVGIQPYNPCFAQRVNEDINVLPLSTANVPISGEATGKTFYATVQWEGQEYHALEGTTILMGIIVDPEVDAAIRAKALQRLGRLRNRSATPQLLALYPRLQDWREKNGVIQCLVWSEDPRGLAVLTEVLDDEQDDVVRLAAAMGLAQWNVRRGVSELVSLLESETILPQDARTPHIRDNALDMFMNYNRRKRWGFPDEKIREAIVSRTDLNEQEMLAIYIGDIRKWFVENKDRFPDWKPGDPLPAAPKLSPIPPGPEDVLSLSAAFRASPTVWTVGQEKKEKVPWQGKRYPVGEGVDVLMKSALEPENVNDRLRALDRLGRIGDQLHHTGRMPQLTERIPELMGLYGRLTDRSEKVILLFCLAKSKDPLALPLFAKILETRQEEYLRLPAAYGLALWNVRSGVRELIELLSVEQTENPVRPPGIIADEAGRFLYRLNYWKSWWAPEATLLAVAEARTGLHDDVLDSCHTEIKKWFAENEHRFPDWKLGDPLPEVEPQPPE